MDMAHTSEPEDRFGSPGFILRPPAAAASTGRASHDEPRSGLAPNHLRNQPHLDRTPTPTKSARQSLMAMPAPAVRVTHPVPEFRHSVAATAQGGTRERDRSEHETRYGAENGSNAAASTAGASSFGGWGRSSGGGESLGGASVAGPAGPAGLTRNRLYHDSFNSSSSRMPDYLKVYTVPKDLHCEEDVIIEPIIQSLGIGDKQLENRIGEQMSSLYEFFKRLYDQDQFEIRSLQTQAAQRDKEMRQLRSKVAAAESLKPALHGQSLISAVPRSPPPMYKSGNGKHGSSQEPVVSLVLPPLLNPARPFYKWWANVYNAYQRRASLWLCLLVVVLVALTVGLLAGLLTHRSNRARATTASVPPYAFPGPAVTQLWPTGLSFTVNMTNGSTAFYALVPTVSLMARNLTPAAADVLALFKGPQLSSLHDIATACGERTVLDSRPYTFLVAAAAASTVAGADCNVAGALPGRCSMCPDVLPSTAYTLLVAFASSTDIFNLTATTSPAPVISRPPSSSPPPLPSELPSPVPPSPLPSPSPPSPLPPSPLPPSPPPPLPTAPNFIVSPAASAMGQSSLGVSFSLGRTGLVRYLIQHSVILAQAGNVYASYASADPPTGQALQASPAPNSAVIGVGGVVASGSVNVTQAGATYTLYIGDSGGSTSSSTGAAPCFCNPVGDICNCTLAAPCQGALCNYGPSALTPGTTYKVFVSASAINDTATTGPLLAGTVTTLPDTVAPVLGQSAAIASLTVTPSGFTLGGLQPDTTALLYVMVTQPLNQQQAVDAGTATTFAEQQLTRRRAQESIQQLRERSWQERGREEAAGLISIQPDHSRALLPLGTVARGLQAAAGSSQGLVTIDPLPAAQVFVPSGPQLVPCDPTQVVKTLLDPSTEVLAVPVRCIVVSNARGGAVSEVISGLANDTTYAVTVMTEDTAGNQRTYKSVMRTVDLRPPGIISISARTASNAFNVTMVVSEPAMVSGSLYTVAGAVGLNLSTSDTWPPSVPGPVLQQATAVTVLTSTGVAQATLQFRGAAIVPNNNYTVALLARDLAGNAQPGFTWISLRTDDNQPPQWLAAAVTPGPYSGNLTVMLDEPGTVYYVGLAGNATCPTAAVIFNATGAPSPPYTMRGSFTVVNNVLPAIQLLTGLTNDTLYTLCLVAEDASPLRNRHSLSRLVSFRTLDRTPPILSASVVAGTDGNVSCDRSTLKCGVLLNVSLSERGSVALALQYDPWVTNFTAAQLSAINLTAPGAGVLRAAVMELNASSSQQLQLSALASDRNYILMLAGVDLSENVQPAVAALRFTTPDIVPPRFINFTATSLADQEITISGSLDEPCAVLWVVQPSGTAAPTAAQLASLAQLPTAPLAHGSFAYNPAAAASPAAWTAGGLTAGRLYDVYATARDLAGNLQTAEVAVLNVRIRDSSAPVITLLTATSAATGNRLTLAVNSTKPGRLFYLAITPGSPVPSIDQLLQPSTYPASANFSGQLPLPTAYTPASAVMCIADSSLFQIWAVQQDLEGTFPGRVPNYSNITRATVVQQQQNSSTMCSPEGTMQALRLDAMLNGSSSGWGLGRLRRSNSTSNASGTVWVREYALLGGTSSAGGAIRVSVDGVTLGAAPYQNPRLPPARALMVLQTPALIQDVAAVSSLAASTTDPGRMLRLAYQLQDAGGRATVATAGLRLQPVLITSLAASSDGRVPLPDCASPPAAGLVGGLGVCEVAVPAQLFPAAGSPAASAAVQLEVYDGASMLAQSATAQLNLKSIALAPLTPTQSAAALRAALPARMLRTGETFRVTLAAAASSNQPAITGLSLQLLFNGSRLAFVRAQQSSLWSDLVSVALPDAGGMTSLWLTALTRTASDSMYVGNNIPLCDVFFTVSASAADGVTAGATVILPALTLASTSRMYPYSTAPQAIFQDVRSNVSSTGGSIQVAAPRQLAFFAYLASHDLFNTAVLDGNEVIAPVKAAVAYDWAPTANATLVAVEPLACVAATAMSTALRLDGVCRLVLAPSHTQPLKLANVSVAYVGTLVTQVVVSVWYPGDLRLEADDPDGVLSSLLPYNVPSSAAASCADRYQSTRLSLYATWRTGGSDALDTLVDADVTALVSRWSTGAPTALQLSGATATGLAPQANISVMALAPNGSTLAASRLTVSDEPVCVVSVDTLALSAVAVAGDTQTAPDGNGRWRVRFTPQQVLNQEGAIARVSVFATLSDGSTAVVTTASTTSAMLPTASAATAVMPFSLASAAGQASQLLRVNVSYGVPATCGTYLGTSWGICGGPGGTSGIPLGAGTGLVRVALPVPTRIAALTVSPLTIASRSNGASQPPLGVPTRAALRVLVAYDDGTLADMTQDSRVQLAVVQGADLCGVVQDAATGAPFLEVIGDPRVGGNCTVEARATFPGLPQQLLASNRTSVVTLSALQVYMTDSTPAAPPTLNSTAVTGLVSTDVALRLFKCDFSHYTAASVWVLGRLSTCGASCQLADLNNPAYTSLSLSDTSAVSLGLNPSNANLSNILFPTKPGQSRLTVAFGSTASLNFNVSVEDTFQPGWPQVINITDGGFVILANMTSAAFRVSYLIRTAAAIAAASSPPSASEVEQGGVALSYPAANATSAAGPFLLADTVVGMAPATNYTVYLAVRSGTRLLGTVVAVAGVLTPDTRAPTFAAATAAPQLSVDSASFTLRLPVALDEAGSIAYAVYRNTSCITGTATVPTIITAGSLPAGVCRCNDTSACAPVAWGNITLSGGGLTRSFNDSLSIVGALPPNPYASLRDLPADQLTCRTGGLPAPASAWHTLYLVAQDDLPTFRNWTLACVPPAASPGSGCGALAAAPCSAAPPGPGTATGANTQAEPYSRLQLSTATALQGAASRPILAAFQLPTGATVAFEANATSITALSRTITMRFRVTRPAAVQYRLDRFNGTAAFSGLLPVFDQTLPYSVSISRDCAGALLDEPSYTLWYWATDVYGRSSPPLSASVVVE